ncbi:ABC transporter permease [Microtetraspora sp. NBRC 13810]|uniref:carbohydrate ABC transporter permease n=1 Tax=Microtetraspora sp. NBRC 13810 TaxID=3030990 RepID=UPI00249FC71E|nr:carbohydrate ABC transporter permease [Microtetraspora sp. NBRC 13810]GLW08133.1 ABC transporter permease [Microtetraspora sp. NBRC 13810]
MSAAQTYRSTAARSRARAAVPGRTPASPPWRAAKGVLLLICCLLVIVPFLSIVATSLADNEQVTEAGGFVLWPERPSFAAYSAVLAGGVVTRALAVSVGVTVAGTALALLSSITLAYGLSRPGTFGHRPVLMILLFSLLFTPGVIPSYLLIKQLGLINSYWSLILPTMVNAFNVIVLRAFFMGLPRELLDAARIDGANALQILRRIVVPLSRAAIAVVGLFYAVSFWNAFFNAMLYMNESESWPMQLVLRTYVVNNAAIGAGEVSVAGAALPPSYALQAAILVLSIVPIVVVYPFLQRHLRKGVMIGAVKG